MRRTSRWSILLSLVLFAMPSIARADDSGPPTADARLLGYGSNIAPPPSSTAADWFILVGLGLAGVGVMFIDSRRSHLD